MKKKIMGMIKLTAAEMGVDGKPSEKRIEFQIDEDLVEMIFDGKYYFEKDERGYLSEVGIDGKVYVDIKLWERPKKGITIHN